MFLYFLRHASAGQTLSSAKKDEKRGLDKDGIEQCGYIGRALAALGVQVEVIVSSPLKRSTQTAALVGNEMGHEGKLVKENALRPQAGFSEFQKMLEKYARQDSVPFLRASTLSSNRRRARKRLSPCWRVAWHLTWRPVGRCSNMTQVAVLFTFWPPCPPERTKVSSMSASRTPSAVMRWVSWVSLSGLTGNAFMGGG